MEKFHQRQFREQTREYERAQREYERDTRRFYQEAHDASAGKAHDIERALSLLSIKGIEGLSTKSLRQAYLQAAKKYHPDADPANKGGEKFKEAAKAYELLRGFVNKM